MHPVKESIDRLEAAFAATVGKRPAPVIASEAGVTWVAVGCFATAALVTLVGVATGYFLALRRVHSCPPLASSRPRPLCHRAGLCHWRSHR